MTLEFELKKLYDGQEKSLRRLYNRSLSFQDGFFDRFERAKKLKFGEGSSIYNSALVFGDVTVGKNTWVGPNVILDGSGAPLIIGDYCSISAGVHIYTHDSVMWALTGGKSSFQNEKVKVESNVYVGAQSIIKAGVTVGRYAVIGANSYVNRKVNSHTIVAGSPAKIIGHVVIENNKVNLQYR